MPRPSSIHRSALALFLPLSLAALAACKGDGGSTGSGGHGGSADPCASMPEAPAATGTADPCRYAISAPSAGMPVCPVIASWTESPLGGPDPTKPRHCVYEWSDPSAAPTNADLMALPAGVSPACTYVTPQGAADNVSRWARQALIDAAGQPLGASKSGIDARVLVLDTVPEAAMAGAHPPPEAQHGLTLARLIGDLACAPTGSCAVGVRTALGIPRLVDPDTRQPHLNADGGAFGLLTDAASRLWDEARRYRDELHDAALGNLDLKTVPARVVVVSAFGFDNETGVDRCDDHPAGSSRREVKALYEAYQASACLGMLHVAAAGNSNGDGDAQGGMLCPARWDHAIVPNDADCATLWGGQADFAQIKADYQAVTNKKYASDKIALFQPAKADHPADALLSVAGVDYAGEPLVLSRPGACAEAAAIGLGGASWIDDKDVPPFLFGTSVSAAVAGARLALAWRTSIAKAPVDLTDQVRAAAHAIPFQRKGHCDPPVAVACEGTIPWIGEPPAPILTQNPPMPDKVKDDLRAWPDRHLVDPPGEAVCVERIPHCARASVAATTALWPQPVEPICVKCGIFVIGNNNTGDPELWLDGNTTLTTRDIASAALIVEDSSGTVLLTKRLAATDLTSPTTVVLSGVSPTIFRNSRAWISVYTTTGRSLSQAIFVIE
ncbi:MAG: hypothetical protein U0359_20195 [Byssovorax sp.]